MCFGCLMAVLHRDLHAVLMLNGSVTLGFACVWDAYWQYYMEICMLLGCSE